MKGLPIAWNPAEEWKEVASFLYCWSAEALLTEQEVGWLESDNIVILPLYFDSFEFAVGAVKSQLQGSEDGAVEKMLS